MGSGSSGEANVKRSMSQARRNLLTDLLAGFSTAPGVHRENVMVCFKETAWENSDMVYFGVQPQREAA